MEPPIRTLVADFGYTNLIEHFKGSAAHTFVFGGRSGCLDHMLASPSAAAAVVGLDIWHINADEPRNLDYNMEHKSANQVNLFYHDGPYRSSDHDPVLIGVSLPTT